MPDFYYQPPKPDNNSKKIVWLIILGITVIVLLFAYNARIKFVTTLLPETHTCNWEDCQQQDKIMNIDNFTSTWKYEPDTDSYYTELTHFMNPSWTYEECEDYVFSQP